MAVHNDNDIIADGRKVGVATTAFVVNATVCDGCGGVVGARCAIGLICRVVVGEVRVQLRVLVRGSCVDVAEAPAGGKACGGYFVIALCAGTSGKEGGAKGGYIWT